MIPSEERSTAVGEVWWVQRAVPGRELRGDGEASVKMGRTSCAATMQPVRGGTNKGWKVNKVTVNYLFHRSFLTERSMWCEWLKSSPLLRFPFFFLTLRVCHIVNDIIKPHLQKKKRKENQKCELSLHNTSVIHTALRGIFRLERFKSQLPFNHITGFPLHI